jgi:uncharacterized membrane protein
VIGAGYLRQVMADQFISPNWHPLLIHYPIALLTLGLVVEILSIPWPRAALRAAGRWMILLGALLALPALLAGIYAFRDAVAPGAEMVGDHWYEVLKQSAFSGQQWQYMTWHIWLNSAAVVATLAAAVIWLASSDRSRARLYVPLLALLILGVGAMIVGSWFGGESVYRMAVSVAEKTNEQAASAAPVKRAGHDVAYFLPPLQLHLVMAGTTVMFAVAAMAVMSRKWKREPIVEPPMKSTEHLQPSEIAIVAEAPRLMPGRLWILAFVAGVVTAFAGAWATMGPLTAQALRDDVKMLSESDERRLLLHVITGVLIVLLPLPLAGMARLMRRRRAIAGMVTLVLFLLIGWQIWLGIAMLYDSHEGPLWKFAKPEAGKEMTTTAPASQPAHHRGD